MDRQHMELRRKFKKEPLEVQFHLVNSIKTEKLDQVTEDGNILQGQLHETFQCTLCTLIFSKQKLLDHHKIVHNKEILKQEDLDIPARATNSIKLKKSSKVCTTNSTLQNERKYQCDLCEKSFVRNHHLKKHLKTHQPNEERLRFPCKFCSKTFLQEYQLGTHMSVHTGEKPFQCEFCETRFGTTHDRLAHLKQNHSKEKLHKCSQCSASFVCKSKLVRHEITHRTHKLDLRLFKCPKCAKAFTQDGHLKSHLLVHDNPNQFACDVCGRNFGRKCSLDKHKLLHGTHRKFPCSFCPKKFTRFDTLNEHIRIHTGEKPHKCKYCSKTFVQLGNLKVHERSSCKITIKLREKCQGTPDINLPEPFHCSICRKYFGCDRDLKVHISRVHDKERPFSCNLCDKKYKSKQHLETHIRSIHTKENSYRCNFCDKKYPYKSGLSRHYASQSGSLCRQKKDKESLENIHS